MTGRSRPRDSVSSALLSHRHLSSSKHRFLCSWMDTRVKPAYDNLVSTKSIGRPISPRSYKLLQNVRGIRPMNHPARVIGFVNAAHFIDHYSMLIFAAAVIVMGPALGMSYSELLPYATPGFIAFGAGSLLTGWLGDRWSRRHMMVIFFVGIRASMIAVGLVQTPLQLGAALLSIGLFASIYHPVGTAMIVSYADRLGRAMGLNGVWGNLGVGF